MFSALLLVGVSSCEKSGDGGAGAADSTATANTNATPAGSETNAEPVSNMPATSVEFMEESHNFGEVPEGDKVSHTFKFKNTGSNPLRVSNVKPSCGCTTPD